LLVAAGIVAAFHVGKVPPSIPSIREELGASLEQAGWLLSMVNLITALGGMAIALTADRFGHRRLILIGTSLAVAASGLGAFAGSVDALLVDGSSRDWASLPSWSPSRPWCCASPGQPTSAWP
jgi:MFS family permease